MMKLRAFIERDDGDRHERASPTERGTATGLRRRNPSAPESVVVATHPALSPLRRRAWTDLAQAVGGAVLDERTAKRPEGRRAERDPGALWMIRRL
ncbi:hypothetical protein ACRAWD_27320 [Caulobacter segnis]